MCIKYISSHIINYQHVSIAFMIIIGVALQEYEEHNNMPHWILGTTQNYNKCLKHGVVPLLQFTVFLVLMYPDDDDKSCRYMLVINNIS